MQRATLSSSQSTRTHTHRQLRSKKRARGVQSYAEDKSVVILPFAWMAVRLINIHRWDSFTHPNWCFSLFFLVDKHIFLHRNFFSSPPTPLLQKNQQLTHNQQLRKLTTAQLREPAWETVSSVNQRISAFFWCSNGARTHRSSCFDFLRPTRASSQLNFPPWRKPEPEDATRWKINRLKDENFRNPIECVDDTRRSNDLG